MAIYTNFGRYIKAREFKKILSGEDTEAYMLFGIGNPAWDTQGEIPIAPYNTSIITEDTLINGSPAENQFADFHINQYFMSSNGAKQTIRDGVPTENDSLANITKDQLPPFPCIWQHYEDSDTENLIDTGIMNEDTGTNYIIKREDYQKYYITSVNDTYTLYNIDDSTFQKTIAPILDGTEAQYFAELVLRGNSLNHNMQYLNPGIEAKVPVGLLGAVKCSIDFVKDIGTDEDNQYTGKSNQFFYGDRYWEIISPDEKLTGDDVLPHHLIITSTINPRNMQESLKIDKSVVVRQIAIYVRKKKKDSSGNYIDGKPFYRVYQNLFNFGQYEQSDFKDDLPDNCGEILNFVPAYYTVSSNNDKILHQDGVENRFNLLLVDYIKGSTRADNHAIDRIGYVIGF